MTENVAGAFLCDRIISYHDSGLLLEEGAHVNGEPHSKNYDVDGAPDDGEKIDDDE